MHCSVSLLLNNFLLSQNYHGTPFSYFFSYHKLVSKFKKCINHELALLINRWLIESPSFYLKFKAWIKIFNLRRKNRETSKRGFTVSLQKNTIIIIIFFFWKIQSQLFRVRAIQIGFPDWTAKWLFGTNALNHGPVEPSGQVWFWKQCSKEIQSLPIS